MIEKMNDAVLPEDETRRRILNKARRLGREKEVILIMKKYDTLLRNCSNSREREDIAKLGCYEVYAALDRGGELYVDGQLVYKDD